MKYTFDKLQLAALKVKLAYAGFSYQIGWYKSQSRIRHITKTRQCGADWYFSLEALIDAIETGRNQNFIAPDISHALASNRERIMQFASLVGVTISPDDSPIILSNGAEIHFFGGRSLFAGSHGSAYVSEYAWSDNPSAIFKAGRAISMHKKNRFTAYTTPSENREAYSLWLTENPLFKQRLSASQALKQGSTLIDPVKIKNEFPARDFEMLFDAIWPQENKEAVE